MVNMCGCIVFGNVWLIRIYSVIEIVLVFKFCISWFSISIGMCWVSLVISRLVMK